MHYLFFLNSMSGGGAERVTANLANHWVSEGHHATIVTLTTAEDDAYTIDPAVNRIGLGLGDESNSVFAAITNNIKRVRALRRCLRQTRPDAAIAIMSTASCLLGMVGRSACKLRIGTERIHPPQLALGRIWERIRVLAYGQLDCVVALTAESAVWLQENTKAKKVVVIPNAVSLPLGQSKPLKAVKDHIQPGKKTILAVGRLNEQKGFDRLLKAFGQIAAEFPQWNVVILGDGPLREELEQSADSLGIGDRVTLLGQTGNVADWYQAADLYVMTSLFEGFPMVLVEAMAHGLPPVSVDCNTGPREIIRHGKDGLLVPQDDPEALVVALHEMMSDDTKRHMFSCESLGIRARYSMRKIAAEWEAIIHKAASSDETGIGP